MPETNKIITGSEKKEAQKLLDELNTKKPEELSDWNIRAQTFLFCIGVRNLSLWRPIRNARDE